MPSSSYSYVDKLKDVLESRKIGGTEYFCKNVLNVRLPNGSGETLTWQQKEAALAWDKIFAAKYKRVQLLKSGQSLSSLTDEEIMWAKKIGVTVQSGKATGKTCFETMLASKYLACYKHARVFFIGASEDQVKETSWAQLSEIIENSKIKDDFNIKATSVTLKLDDNDEELALAKYHFIKNKASGADAKNFAGQHSPILIYIFTEASSISRDVAREIESTLGYDFGISMIWVGFNPDRPVCYASETQTVNRDNFACFIWNAEESPLASKDYLEQQKKKFGEDSWHYLVYTKGILPESSSDSLISWRWLQEAVSRNIIPNKRSPVVFSIDPARGGGCECVLGYRQEWCFGEITAWEIDDTYILADKISRKITEIINNGIVENRWNKDVEYYIAIEMDGLGASLYDNLVHHPLKVGGSHEERFVLVQMNRAAENRDPYVKCKTKRDEYWYKTREVFQKGLISIPDDTKMINQLSLLTFDTSSGFWKAFSKKTLKESPDRADILPISAAVDTQIDRIENSFENFTLDNSPEINQNDLGWLTI